MHSAGQAKTNIRTRRQRGRNPPPAPARYWVAASRAGRLRATEVTTSAGSYVGSMTGRNGDSPYLDLDRHAWRSLRASVPMSLTAGELDELRGLTDPIQLSEVEDIYLPLSRLLRLYFEASAGLRETVGAFLGQQIQAGKPFSSSRSPRRGVAVGKVHHRPAAPGARRAVAAAARTPSW